MINLMECNNLNQEKL